MSRIAVVIFSMCILNSVHAYAPITDKFLNSLETIESGRNPKAVGDGGRAVGILQIHKIYVREANRILKAPVFGYDDRKDVKASRYMTKTVLAFWARYHEKKGIKIGYPELCSLHRMPNHKWTPKNMRSKLEQGRTNKMKKLMK